MQFFIFLSNYFGPDECCFPKFKHFSKLPNVFLPFRNKLQIGKNRSADLQTEQLLVFAKENITKSYKKKKQT